MKKLLLNLTMLLVAMLWGGVAQGAETTVTQELTGHTSIMGTNMYSEGQTKNTMFYLNSYIGNGGAATLNFKLDENFDVTKIKSAELKLYVNSQANNGGRQGNVNFFALSSLDKFSDTYSEFQDGKVKVYSYGSAKTKRYAFSGTSAVSVTHNSANNQFLKNATYNSIDVTDLVKQYTTQKAGDEVYIGISISDFAAVTWIQGYGSENQPVLNITYSSESAVPYTINYKLGDEIIKTSNGSYVVGEKIEAESPITVDGTKYYTADDAKTSFTVTSDEENNVFNVALRKANEYAYTVTNSFGEQLTSGTGIEGEAVTGNYVQYISKNGTLHEAERGKEEYYKYSFIPTDNNYNYNIVYKETNINNVVYFSEGEDIEGMTSTGNANADIRCSNGKGGYSNEAIIATTLQPGKYKVTANVWGNTGATFEIKANETSILSIATTGSITSKTSEEFELTESTPITISGGDRSKMLDYIYITKTADILNLNTDYVYSTYCPETDLDFSNVEDVKAYSVKVNGKAITLNEINGKVKAGEGILIANTGKVASVTVPVTTGAESIADNDLKGVTADMTASQLVDNNAYILVDDNTFQKVGDSTIGTLKKGKAYLQVNNASAAKQMFIVNPTAVNGVKEQTENAAAVIYNAQGMQVKTPVKGLYIVNGKKYIK